MAIDFTIDRSNYVGNTYLYDIKSRSTRTSSKSPRYFGKLHKVENVIDRSWTTTYGTLCQWYVNTPYGEIRRYHDGGYERVPEPPYSLVQQAETEAFEKARDYAYANVANVQMKLWEYFVERRQIAATLLQKAELLRDVVQALKLKSLLPFEYTRRKRYYNRRKREWIEEKWTTLVHRSFADLWLENAFMWQPIIKDITTLMDGIKPTRGLFVTGVGRVDVMPPQKDDKRQVGPNAWQTNSNQARVKVRCKVKLFVTIDDPLQAMLHEVGILNLSAPYDAVPFSFVLDWFLKVGSFLERISTPGKTITDGSTTYLTECSAHTWAVTRGVYSEENGKKLWYQSAGAGVKKTSVLYRRTLGVPSPWYLTTAKPGELWHAITTWALISQIIHSGFKPKRGRHFDGY